MVSYFMPDIDNFWHAQSMLMLLGRRLPLHVIFICKYCNSLRFYKICRITVYPSTRPVFLLHGFCCRLETSPEGLERAVRRLVYSKNVLSTSSYIIFLHTMFLKFFMMLHVPCRHKSVKVSCPSSRKWVSMI